MAVNIQSIGGVQRARAAGTTEKRELAFFTPASIVNFPGATFAVSIIWVVLRAVFGGWSEEKWVALAAAGFVGIGLYLINLKTSDGGREPIDYAIQAFVGILNVFVLAAATLGVFEATGAEVQ